MKRSLTHLLIILLLLFLSAFVLQTFKDEQKRYPRVRQAYLEKESVILNLLSSHNIKPDSLNLYLRAFKNEKRFEVWAKNSNDAKYQLITEYKICKVCGKLGPKRKQGDLQIPEGFYHINVFNPYSNFYLSLGINYPNTSDRILGDKNDPGGDIFIHGSCVTIGCIPLTDDKIKELYILCVEAKNAGQDKIPVTIYPAEMNEANFSMLCNQYQSNLDFKGLWFDQKKAFQYFERERKIPRIKFLRNGRHQIN